MTAAALWGRYWSGKRVHFYCDNMAVVAVMKSGTSRDPGLMHLLRCFHFYAAEAGFEYWASHIEGRLNTAADALFRNNAVEFFSLVPQAQHQMSPIPEQLVDLLLISQPDWTSQRWARLFRHSLQWV